jgi:hypothetical protein
MIFNLLGMLDLIFAVALGIMTNRGPAQVLYTRPTAELLTYFPLALVPNFPGSTRVSAAGGLVMATSSRIGARLTAHP